MGYATKCFNCGEGLLVIVDLDKKKEEVKSVCNSCRSIFYVSIKEDEKK